MRFLVEQNNSVYNDGEKLKTKMGLKKIIIKMNKNQNEVMKKKECY